MIVGRVIATIVDTFVAVFIAWRNTKPINQIIAESITTLKKGGMMLTLKGPFKNIHRPNEIRFAPHWHEFHRAGRGTDDAEILVFFCFSLTPKDRLRYLRDDGLIKWRRWSYTLCTRAGRILKPVPRWRRLRTGQSNWRAFFVTGRNVIKDEAECSECPRVGQCFGRDEHSGRTYA